MQLSQEDKEKILNSGERYNIIDLIPEKFDYNIRNCLPVSYYEADNLEDRKEWFNINYPKHPDGISEYLAKLSLDNKGKTKEELAEKRILDLRAIKIRDKQVKTKEKIRVRRLKKNRSKILNVQHGEFIVKFE